MSDDQRRTTLHEAFEGFLNDGFVLGIDVREGFVEEENRCVLEQGAGDGDALALSAGETQAAFAHHRLIALGQGLDELMRIRRPRRRLDLILRGVWLAEAQIVRHRAVHEIGILHDHRDMAPQHLQGQAAEVMPAERDAPLLRVEKTQQKPDHGRFAGATGPH